MAREPKKRLWPERGSMKRRDFLRSVGVVSAAMAFPNARLFGSWEMNWMAYNFAHDTRIQMWAQISM